MNFNFTKKILIMSGYMILGVVLQCVFYSFMLADNTNAQGKSINDIYVDLESSGKVENVFRDIEKTTGFTFLYNRTKLDLKKKVSVNAANESLADVLTSLAEQTNFKFKRVNNVISVSELEEDDREEVVEQIFQSVTISGKVVSQEEHEGIPGVNVVIKGTSTGTVTDVQGNYSINVFGPEAVLVFSSVGFISEEISVGNLSTINVELTPDITSLEEIIVVGYGVVKKENLTNSISKMSAEAIDSRPITTLGEALAGQLAGVRAQNTTGIPGAELKIKIRGVNTINGSSEPLYVVDGIPRDMIDLNPNDIESIQVLKDASATAIYGSRGANGVVLIETKKGEGKSTINFEAKYSLQQAEKKVPVMDAKEWVAYNSWRRNEEWLRAGGSMNDPMSARPINLQVPDSWNDPNLEGTDWQDAITQVAPMQSYTLSSSSKSDKGSLYMSGGYLTQEGIVKHTYYNRLNFRVNGEMNVNSNLKMGISLAPSISKQADGETQGKETVIHHALGMSPLVGLHEGTVETGYPSGVGRVYANPLERLKHTVDDTKRGKMLSSVFAELQLAKGLTFKTLFSYDYQNENYEYFQPHNVRDGQGPTTGYSWSQTWNDWTLQNTLNYSNTFKDHSLEVLLGQGLDQHKWFYIRADASGWPADNISTLNVATLPTGASTDKTTYATASFFGRAGYTFKNTYILNASVRYDGSSRFGSNNKWGLFPAVSAGWKISEENFMRDLNWLSLLKVRASWGTSGNDRIGNYDYLSNLELTTTAWGDQIVPAVAPGNIENPDLKWERTETIDLGIDFWAFEDRIQLSFDYYKNTTDQLLFDAPVALTTGFESIRTNLGKIQNSGWEIDLTSINTSGVFNWSTSINLSATRNKVLDLGGDEEFVTDAWPEQKFITRVGGPVSQFYTYRTDGILTYDDFDSEGNPLVAIMSGQEAGNPQYVDQNDDGVINSSDLVPYGSVIPKMIYGMTNRFEWKNLQLSVLIQGQLGADIMFNGQRQMDSGGKDLNQFSRWVHAWKPVYEDGENPIPDTDVDMSWDGETYYPFGKIDNNSDLRVFDASFLRVKNMTLSYQVPENVFVNERFPLKRARVYLSVENLLTLSDYPGVNPEANSYGDDKIRQGVDYSTYPFARIYTLGFNLTF